MSATKKVLSAFDRILESYRTVYIVLGMIFVALLSPLVLMFFTAFKTPAETEMWPPTIVPLDVDLNAFADVIFNSNIPLAIFNSLIISLTTVAIVVVASTFTAYGLSRYRYRGSRILSYSLLATRIIPPISLTIPFFAIFAELGLVNK